MTLSTERYAAIKVLQEVKKLLGNGIRWTSGAYARDICGDKVHPKDVAAKRFDIDGAVSSLLNQPRTPDTEFLDTVGAIPVAYAALYSVMNTDYWDATEKETLDPKTSDLEDILECMDVFEEFIEQWQDTRTRTPDEVIQKIEEAIEAL